jgi:hypothetical protein
MGELLEGLPSTDPRNSRTIAEYRQGLLPAVSAAAFLRSASGAN